MSLFIFRIFALDHGRGDGQSCLGWYDLPEQANQLGFNVRIEFCKFGKDRGHKLNAAVTDYATEDLPSTQVEIRQILHILLLAQRYRNCLFCGCFFQHEFSFQLLAHADLFVRQSVSLLWRLSRISSDFGIYLWPHVGGGSAQGPDLRRLWYTFVLFKTCFLRAAVCRWKPVHASNPADAGEMDDSEGIRRIIVSLAQINSNLNCVNHAL